MNEHAKKVKKVDETDNNLKTENDWVKFKTKEEWKEWLDKNNIPEQSSKIKMAILKKNYLKYGSIYGKKYAVVTDYGDWDIILQWNY